MQTRIYLFSLLSFACMGCGETSNKKDSEQQKPSTRNTKGSANSETIPAGFKNSESDPHAKFVSLTASNDQRALSAFGLEGVDPVDSKQVGADLSLLRMGSFTTLKEGGDCRDALAQIIYMTGFVPQASKKEGEVTETGLENYSEQDLSGEDSRFGYHKRFTKKSSSNDSIFNSLLPKILELGYGATPEAVALMAIFELEFTDSDSGEKINQITETNYYSTSTVASLDVAITSRESNQPASIISQFLSLDISGAKITYRLTGEVESKKMDSSMEITKLGSGSIQLSTDFYQQSNRTWQLSFTKNSCTASRN